MEVTRRGWLGLAGAAGALATSAPLRAGSAVPGKYGAVVDRVRAFARADLAAKGFPGMVLALVAPDGFSHSTAIGLANVDTRQPASPDQLFQIGSLTKSLTAMALFALADRGKLDLDARAADYLPDHPLPPEPITLRHLLEHSSGLPNSLGDDPFPTCRAGGYGPASRRDRAIPTAISATICWARWSSGRAACLTPPR
jgi:CubicO group peptidase (beta-lactamase class C family)